MYSEKDAEQLKNHYKFHKGTTYSIGNEKNRAAVLGSQGLHPLADNIALPAPVQPQDSHI